MKTYTPKPQEIERRWWVVDVQGRVLGRVATEIARILRGKHKPTFTSHLDTGDYVVVVNAAKIRLTGEKANNKA
jgi:large subunit ribosomal protein L13